MSEKTKQIKRVQIYRKELPSFVISVMQILFTTFLVCLACVLIFLFIYIYTPVEGKSMMPTLNASGQNTDHVYINRFASGTYQDLIVVSREDKHPIKRLIAKGGDKVSIVQYTADGEVCYATAVIKKGETEKTILDESYLDTNCDMKQTYEDFKNVTSNHEWHSFTVYDNDFQTKIIYLEIPDNYIFYLGDNRGHSSYDCSDYGPIPANNLIGRVDIIVKKGQNNFRQIISSLFHKIFK